MLKNSRNRLEKGMSKRDLPHDGGEIPKVQNTNIMRHDGFIIGKEKGLCGGKRFGECLMPR